MVSIRYDNANEIGVNRAIWRISGCPSSHAVRLGPAEIENDGLIIFYIAGESSSFAADTKSGFAAGRAYLLLACVIIGGE